MRRAFRCMCVLRCRGRATQTCVVTAGAAATVTGPAASSSTPLAASVVAGRGLHPAAPAAAAGVDFSLSLTAVRPHLRLLDLSNTTTLSSLDGMEVFVALEKIVLTLCSQLRSLSPLGAAPSLTDTIASQSGIFDFTGLAQGRTLPSLSLQGCLDLTDVSACGAIPMVRDMFISESTVTVLDGLRESHTLARLGVRDCDVPLVTALSPMSSSIFMHASSTTPSPPLWLRSTTLRGGGLDGSACAQLADLGPLGLLPCLRDVEATGSGVLPVSGLSRSWSLERLLLAQCIHFDEVGSLDQCFSLRERLPHWHWSSAFGGVGSRPIFA